MSEDEATNRVEKIRECLIEEDYFEARKALAKFIFETGLDHSTLLILADCLRSPCFLLRYETLCELKEFTDDYFVRSAIIERLADDSWLIRQEALTVLGKYIESDNRILPLILNALKDESPIVVDKALNILDPYINKDNKNIIKSSLKGKHLLLNTIDILLKHLSLEDLEEVVTPKFFLKNYIRERR